MKPTSKPMRSIYLLFILSGFSSLIYQTIWIRQLALSLGSTASSMSIVLAIYFIGLASGSFYFGKKAPLLTQPLRNYAIVEGLIGLYGVILVQLLFRFQTFLSFVYPNGSLTWSAHLIKIIAVFALLIPPTFLMGATFPLLIRYFSMISNPNSTGKHISLLYSTNTLGAVCGAFFSGFLFIPLIGIEGTHWLASASNFLILFLALRIPISTLKNEEPSSTDPTHNASQLLSQGERSLYSVGNKSFFLLATTVTGFSSLLCEVVWSKYLGIFMGTNIFGLSLLLALFLLGLALGAFGISKIIDHHRNPGTLFIQLLLAATVSTALSSYILSYLPTLVNLITTFYPTPYFHLLIKVLLSSLILILPTLFFGALFPLTLFLLTKCQPHSNLTTSPTRLSGELYAFNTLGSVFGSYLAGVVLIPNFGSGWTVNLGILALLMLSLLFLFIGKLHIPQKKYYSALLMFLILLTIYTPGLNYTRLLQTQDIAFQKSLKDNPEEFQLVVEGETAIISLSHDPQGGPDYQRFLRLKTNGLNESVYDTKNLDALPKYEALLGLLPYTFSRTPERAFLVGFGGGYSVQLLKAMDVKEIHIAELEKGILEAYEFATHQDPTATEVGQTAQLNLAIEDARFILTAGTHAPFDIIASQPSHSWLSGVANLFTQEFFELVKSRLTDRGVFSQWLNLYNMNEQALKSLIKTFYSTFPHGAIFTRSSDEELILIGSKSPLQFNYQRTQALLSNPYVKNKLRLLDMNSPEDLLAHLVLGREEALRYAEMAPINTDKNAYAEIRQSLLFYNGNIKRVGPLLDQFYSGKLREILPTKELQQPFLTSAILASLQRNQDQVRSSFYVKANLDLLNSTDSSGTILAEYYFNTERYASAKDRIDQILQHHEPSPRILDLRLQIALMEKDFVQGIEIFKKYRKISAVTTECLALRLAIKGSAQKEFKELSALAAVRKKEYQNQCGIYFQLVLAEVFANRGNTTKALEELGPFLEYYPTDLSGQELKLALLTKLNSNAETLQAQRLLVTQIKESEMSRLADLANHFTGLGFLDDAANLKLQSQARNK